MHFIGDLGACGNKTWIIDSWICCSAVQNQTLSDRDTLQRSLKWRNVPSSLTKPLRKGHQHWTDPHKYTQLQRFPADRGGDFVVWRKQCLWGVKIFQKSKNYWGESWSWFFTSLHSPLCKNNIGEVLRPSTPWNLVYLSYLVVWGGLFPFLSEGLHWLLVWGGFFCIWEGRVSSFWFFSLGLLLYSSIHFLE